MHCLPLQLHHHKSRLINAKCPAVQKNLNLPLTPIKRNYPLLKRKGNLLLLKRRLYPSPRNKKRLNVLYKEYDKITIPSYFFAVQGFTHCALKKKLLKGESTMSINPLHIYKDLVKKVEAGNKSAARIIRCLREQYPEEAIGPKVLWLDQRGIRGSDLVTWHNDLRGLSNLNSCINKMVAESMDSETQRMQDAVLNYVQVSSGNSCADILLKSIEQALTQDQFIIFLNDLKETGLQGQELFDYYDSFCKDLKREKEEHSDSTIKQFVSHITELKQDKIRERQLKQNVPNMWKVAYDVCREETAVQSTDFNRIAFTLHGHFENERIANVRTLLIMAVVDESNLFIHFVFTTAVASCNNEEFRTKLATFQKKFPLPQSFLEGRDLSEVSRHPQLYILKTLCVFYILWCSHEQMGELYSFMAFI